MDVESLAKQLILQNMTPEQQNAVLESVRSSLLEARNNQKRRVSENVGMVVDALKKIEADIRAKYDDLGNQITTRVNSIQDGRDGIDGRDGKDGKDGRPGRDGAAGPMGPAGRDGRDGVDGEDGVSVIDAKIDFDGSLVITLSNGREINVGEVVAPDLAERIKVITNGGGTSQTVIDALASLQAQIDALGDLVYDGTWNASTNTPTLASGVGNSGHYYIVSVAGSTNLNGITDWQPGDWAIFNGTEWQKIDQSWATAGANNNITSMTGITGGISSPDFVQFDTTATVTNAAGRLYWNDTQKTLTVGLNANISADIGQTLYAYATNDESVTINKGQPVYMFAAQGDRVSVKLAYNTGDATSAKTLGICAENIAAGQAGLILCQGVQDGLNLAAYNPGDTLYLGATAGTLTSTKPYAPNHLVYIGVVERANAGNGRLYVRVQNGYEMDELHNVSAQNATNGQVLIYNESTSLWEKHTLTDGTAISITEGPGSITVNNTGVTSAVAGTGISVSGATGAVTITNSAPDQTVALTAGTGISTSGTYPNFTITNSAPDQTVSLTGAGTTSVTGTYPNFTITSNDQYVGTVTSVSGTSPVASSGGATPAISLASGYGDTQNPYSNKTANYVLAAPDGSAGVPTFRAIVAADIPTLNQNTTGTASNVTGTVAIANGGTGQTTRQAAMDALAGAVTAGQYLRGDGTDVVMSAIQAADVPTLNQNTTGSAATLTTARTIQTDLASTSSASFNGSANITPGVTGTLAVANGGTGQTSYTDGQLLIGNSTGNTLAKTTLTAGSGISITNGAGSITIAASGGGGGMADPGANGVVIRTALNTTAARTITAGTGISVSDGDGVSGNPTITNTGMLLSGDQTASGNKTFSGQIRSNATNTPPILADSSGNTLTCRSWVQFRYVSSTLTTAGSFNVSSVTRSNTGRFSISLTNAAPDANGASVMGAYNGTTTPSAGTYVAAVYTVFAYVVSSSAIQVSSTNSANTYTDLGQYSVALFR